MTFSDKLQIAFWILVGTLIVLGLACYISGWAGV